MVTTLLIPATGSSAIFSLISQRRWAMNIFVHSSLDMCRSLERILRFSMLENRRDEIESAIRQIAMEAVIEAVTLVTHMGESVYSSAPGWGLEPVSKNDVRCAGCNLGTGTRVVKRLPAAANAIIAGESKLAKVSLPIYNTPECTNSACHAHSATQSVLGVMQMDVSYSEIDESLNRAHKNRIALSILIALATSFIVLILIRQWVCNPVKDLLEGTRRVAHGELGQVIPVGASST